jgi:hypothetical protein
VSGVATGLAAICLLSVDVVGEWLLLEPSLEGQTFEKEGSVVLAEIFGEFDRL